MKLSVITPSLNQGEFIKETLASVRAAAERAADHSVEHLVIDGGSTDQTLEILSGQSFAKWQSGPDDGQSDAINKGLEQATGDILSYLCADDLVEACAYRNVLRIFEDHPDVDVVYGDYYFLEGDSGWKRGKQAGEFSLARLHRCNFVSQPSTFWRRQVFETHGGFDTTLQYCMDHEYWLRIAPQTRWHYLPSPLAAMRLHSDAKTASRLAPMWWESAAMTRRYFSSPHPWLQALAMQVYGQHYYRLKRRWFQWHGRKRTIS